MNYICVYKYLCIIHNISVYLCLAYRILTFLCVGFFLLGFHFMLYKNRFTQSNTSTRILVHRLYINVYRRVLDVAWQDHSFRQIVIAILNRFDTTKWKMCSFFFNLDIPYHTYLYLYTFETFCFCCLDLYRYIFVIYTWSKGWYLFVFKEKLNYSKYWLIVWH